VSRFDPAISCHAFLAPKKIARDTEAVVARDAIALLCDHTRRGLQRLREAHRIFPLNINKSLVPDDALDPTADGAVSEKNLVLLDTIRYEYCITLHDANINWI
jgi:hypothetical protein